MRKYRYDCCRCCKGRCTKKAKHRSKTSRSTDDVLKTLAMERAKMKERRGVHP